MFGEYAGLLQNDGKILEDYLKAKAIWEHFWKEAIVSFEIPGKGTSIAEPAGGIEIEGDLVSMDRVQEPILRSLQGNMDRNMANVHKRIEQNQKQSQPQGRAFLGQQQQQQPGGKKQTGNGAETNQNGKRQVSQQANAKPTWQSSQRKRSKGMKGKGGGKG